MMMLLTFPAGYRYDQFNILSMAPIHEPAHVMASTRATQHIQ